MKAHWGVVFAMAFTAGCTSLPDGDATCVNVETQQPCGTPQDPAQRAFDDHALPVLEAACMVCHNGGQAEIGFLAGDTPEEIRATILASGIVDVSTPTNSRLLTKGVHTGPYLSAQQASDILQWLTAEQAP